MSNSYRLYTANGSTTDFSLVGIDGWISSGFLKVYVNNILQNTGYSFIDLNGAAPLVRFATAPSANSIVRLERQTPKTVSGFQGNIVNFNDASVLTEADLDNMAKGLLHITQEALDVGLDALTKTVDHTDWDAKSLRIENVGSPVTGSDAVTKGYVDGLTLYGTGVTTPQSWTFSGDGSEVNFTLTSPTPTQTDANLFLVETGGILQRPTTNYTINSAGVLTFTQAPPNGTNNIIVRNWGVTRNVAAFNDALAVNANLTVDGGTLFVDAATNQVGINTTTPGSPLAVTTSSAAGGTFEVVPTSSTTIAQAYNRTSGQYITNNQRGSEFTVSTGTASVSERLRVTSAGNVGINTQTPANTLSVAGTLGVSGSVAFTSDLEVDGSTFKVDSTNNRVSILATNPQRPLAVGDPAGTAVNYTNTQLELRGLPGGYSAGLAFTSQRQPTINTVEDPAAEMGFIRCTAITGFAAASYSLPKSTQIRLVNYIGGSESTGLAVTDKRTFTSLPLYTRHNDVHATVTTADYTVGIRNLVVTVNVDPNTTVTLRLPNEDEDRGRLLYVRNIQGGRIKTGAPSATSSLGMAVAPLTSVTSVANGDIMPQGAGGRWALLMCIGQGEWIVVAQ